MNAMQDHFNISDEEWAGLEKRGLITLDFIKAVPEFQPFGKSQICKIHLMIYVDKHGNFDGMANHAKIAKAVFNSLGVKEKIDVLEYIDFAADGYPYEEASANEDFEEDSDFAGEDSELTEDENDDEPFVLGQ